MMIGEGLSQLNQVSRVVNIVQHGRWTLERVSLDAYRISRHMLPIELYHSAPETVDAYRNRGR
jgi:hypothetical protein